MSPMEPPEESLFSKIMVVGAIILLLAIVGACIYVIYGFISPSQGEDSLVVPSATPSPSPTPSPTPVPTATPTPQPTLQITPLPEVTPTPAPVYQSDVQITSGIKIMTPGIWGNFVIYDEFVSQNNYKVHLYNIANRIDDVIATGNVRSFGCIGSGKAGLLYGANNTIMLYDIEAKTMVQATPNKNIPRAYPNIFGKRLIYTGNDGGSNPATGWVDIFSLYDFEFADGHYNLWANPDLEPQEPRGYGSYVVWWEVNGDGRNIVLFRHDVTPCTLKVISPSGASSDHPRIYGNTIVYHSNIGGTDRIYYYDIGSGSTNKIASMGKQYYADVYEKKIVYDDSRENNWNVYLHDLSNNQDTRLTNEPHDQMMPQVYGSYVIYMDNRNYGSDSQGWDLYILQI